MPRLIWSPHALVDVQRVYRFLAEKNADAAKRAVRAIRASLYVIAKHPEIGRPADAMEPEYRKWPIAFGESGYVALYRYDGQSLVIVAIRHQKEVAY